MDSLEYIFDYTEKYYESQEADIDLEYYASNFDGIRILNIYPDNMKRQEMVNFFTRSQGPVITQVMVEYANRNKERKEEIRRETSS